MDARARRAATAAISLIPDGLMAQPFLDEERASMESTSVCTYCNSLFTDPRLLPCLHSFCRKCLLDLIKKVNTTNVVVCPICRETTAVPTKGIEAVTPNIHFEHEAKITKFEALIKKNVPPPCDECSRDSKSEVISFCCTCESFLCKDCHSQHILSRKLTLHHKMIVLEDTTNLRAKLKDCIVFPEINCSSHPSDAIKFYCSSCKTLVCVQCALTKHCGHHMEDLNAFVNREKVNICESVNKLPEYISKLEILIRNAKAVSGSVKIREKSIGSDVKKVFAELHRHLDERECSLLKQCSTIGHAKVSALSAQMEHLCSIKTAIAITDRFVKQSTDCYNTAEFVSVISTLHSRIAEIKAKLKHTQMELKEDDNINFNADVSAILNAFSVLGSIFVCKNRDYTALHDPILSIKTSNAYHVAIHRNGNLIVANHIGDAVEIYNSEGRRVHTFGCKGKECGQFHHPLGVAVAGDIIYVVEFNGGRCQKLTMKGDFLCEIGTGQLKNAWGCAVSKNGVVYIAEEGNNRVQSFTPDGAIIKVLCSAPLIFCPRDVAIDRTGRIHVACSRSKCVKVFDAAGGFLQKYGDDQLMEPSGVAVDNLGYCFVADWGGCSLHVFDPKGKHIHEVKYDGFISGVAIDDSNHVYVVNHSTQTIYKY